MYKVGGEDVVGDASAEGLNRRPGPKGKAQGAVKAAVFGLRSSWTCLGRASCVRMKWK